MRRLVCALLLSALAGFCLGRDNEASRVILLANTRDSGSMSLARLYANQRRVPIENLVKLPMPVDETITWDQFVQTIFNPLQAWLISHGWIEATAGELTDAYGRTRIAATGNRISYLVAFRGVPLRIENDPARLPKEVSERTPAKLRTNRAAVDSELTLLASSLPDINGAARNPLFHTYRVATIEQQGVIRVTRIDGPTVRSCERMIGASLAAERTGLAGRAYVDLGGPHPIGDEWLSESVQIMRDLGFDVDVDKARAVMPRTARFDAPVLYFGWYAANIGGLFQSDGFRFPPGAIAMHIHSFSASTLRSISKAWCGPLVARGVTATLGNVYEPYLELTHRPDLFLEALARGETLGEAAYYALPTLSWQCIVIGDPLYRPFAKSVEQTFAHLRQESGDPLEAYVILREFNRRARDEPSGNALSWLGEMAREHPSPVLDLRLASELERAGEHEGAAAVLESFVEKDPRTPQEIALWRDAADQFSILEHDDDAVLVYRRLFALTLFDEPWRLAVLPAAIKAASRSGDQGQEADWERQLADLTPPESSG